MKYRRIIGDMIEVYKLLTNRYDDNTVQLDTNFDTRTREHTKKLVVRRCRYDVRKYSFSIRITTCQVLNSAGLCPADVNDYRPCFYPLHCTAFIRRHPFLPSCIYPSRAPSTPLAVYITQLSWHLIWKKKNQYMEHFSR